jgi:hypothetical protein
MDLIEKIKCLPKVIQDLINEYNVMHRIKLKKVTDEYFSIIYNNCKYCYKPISKHLYWSADYFISKHYNIKHCWCNDICFTNYENLTEKDHYMQSINEYMSKKTLQFPRTGL